MIEWGKILVHFEDTTFVYHSDFSKYTEVEGATLENVSYCLFDVGAKKFSLENEKKYT